MKINEVASQINENPLTRLAQQAKGLFTGGLAGRRAVAQQQVGQAQIKRIADRVIAKWNQYLASLPAGAEPSQSLVNFSDNEFKNYVNQTSVPEPTLANLQDHAKVRDYIYKRTQEYIAQSTSRKSASPSQLGQGYNNPEGDAGVDLKGYGYGYYQNGSQGPGWYRDDNNQKITNPTDIQTLNRRYYELKQGAAQGKYTDPDLPSGPGPAQPATPMSFAAKRQAAAKAAQASMAPKVPRSKQSRSIAKPTGPRQKPLPLRIVKESASPEIKQLKEGGNAIPSSTPVKKEDVKTVVELAKRFLPNELIGGLQTDIGSAGYKIESGDIDVMVEANAVVELFDTGKLPDPVKSAKQALKGYFESKGIEANVNGRNVSIGVKYKEQSTGTVKTAQVDVMVIHEASVVAPWHQHGLRGMYDEPDFKGSEVFMLISSIAKHLGLKFDPFGAKLISRETGDVVGRTRKEVAKILLGPKAKEQDLNSVRSMLAALENDPDKEGKLAQARQDAAKGLINLPESAPFNTAEYYRKISDVVA